MMMMMVVGVAMTTAGTTMARHSRMPYRDCRD